MVETKKRLLQFIDYKGLSKRRFCEKNSLSHTIFNNNSAMGSDKLELIYNNYPEINMDWVITGRGKMLYDDSLFGLKTVILAPDADLATWEQYLKESENKIREIVREELHEELDVKNKRKKKAPSRRKADVSNLSLEDYGDANL
jgi:hypothetical protein